MHFITIILVIYFNCFFLIYFSFEYFVFLSNVLLFSHSFSINLLPLIPSSCNFLISSVVNVCDVLSSTKSLLSLSSSLSSPSSFVSSSSSIASPSSFIASSILGNNGSFVCCILPLITSKTEPYLHPIILLIFMCFLFILAVLYCYILFNLIIRFAINLNTYFLFITSNQNYKIIFFNYIRII